MSPGANPGLGGESGFTASLDPPGAFGYLYIPGAGVAQLVERELPKLEVGGSKPLARSKYPKL